MSSALPVTKKAELAPRLLIEDFRSLTPTLKQGLGHD